MAQSQSTPSVGVITILMINSAAVLAGNSLAAAPAAPLVTVAEFCEALDSEAVIISDFAPDIEKYPIANECIEFRRRDPLNSSPLIHFSPRRDHVCTDESVGWKSLELDIGIERHADIPANFSSGKIASITKDDMSISMVGIDMFFEGLNPAGVGADISPLDNASVGRLRCCGSRSGLPHLLAGEPQRQSEGGNYDGGERGDQCALAPICRTRGPVTSVGAPTTRSGNWTKPIRT